MCVAESCLCALAICVFITAPLQCVAVCHALRLVLVTRVCCLLSLTLPTVVAVFVVGGGGVGVGGATCFCSDLRDKAKRALKGIGSQCCILGAMQDLLPRAPLPILKVFLAQFEKVIAASATPHTRGFSRTVLRNALRNHQFQLYWLFCLCADHSC